MRVRCADDDNNYIRVGEERDRVGRNVFLGLGKNAGGYVKYGARVYPYIVRACIEDRTNELTRPQKIGFNGPRVMYKGHAQAENGRRDGFLKTNYRGGQKAVRGRGRKK